jgi:kexin
MSLFGSVIDPSKVELWTVPDDPVDPNTLPPPSTTTAALSTQRPSATTSKQYPKPTEHLPDDHDKAEGEAHKPAFPGNNTSNNSTGPAGAPTPDEGYFAHMSDLLKSQTWLIAALGAVVLFVIGAGVYVYKRRSRSSHYAALGGDDVAMSQVRAGGGGTRELYDAFGELSDGDSDADEEMALRARDTERDGLRYHDGFLDDEDEEKERYVDAPRGEEEGSERTAGGAGTRSPGEESGTSWEHASQTLR